MARRRNRRGACAVVVAVWVLLAASGTSAQEEHSRDRVARLVPRLLSDDEPTRNQAENELFRMGEAGLREMERLARGDDPRLVLVALRLLQSRRWDEGATVLEPQADTAHPRRRQRSRAPDWVLPALRVLPEGSEVVVVRPSEGGAGTTTSGSVVHGGTRLRWHVDGAGRARVTVQEKGGPRGKTYEAESLTALREAHPAIADSLDRVASRHPAVRTLLEEGRARGAGAGLRPADPTARRSPVGPPRRRPLREPIDPPTRRSGRGDTQALPRDAARDRVDVALAPLPSALRAHLRLDDGGLLVESVAPDSPAARMGLLRHDVLVEVDGWKIADAGDAAAAAEALGSGRAVSVTVIRAGARRTLYAIR